MHEGPILVLGARPGGVASTSGPPHPVDRRVSPRSARLGKPFSSLGSGGLPSSRGPLLCGDIALDDNGRQAYIHRHNLLRRGPCVQTELMARNESPRPKPDARDTRVTILLSQSELNELDDFQFGRRFRTRNEAIRQLLRLGLLKAAEMEDEPGASGAKKRRSK